MRNEARAPPGFNHSPQAFATKKDFVTYNHGVAARADRLRALTMKNTGNKIIVGTGASLCMPVWISSTGRIWRGFVRGRQLTHNILDLDSMARLHSLSPSRYIALLALSDFSKAFPSVLHSWIFQVVEFYRFPSGLADFIRAMFSDLLAFVRVKGAIFLLVGFSMVFYRGVPSLAFCLMLLLNLFSASWGMLLIGLRMALRGPVLMISAWQFPRFGFLFLFLRFSIGVRASLALP